MIVTINTDASFHPKHKIGAYAFWIVSDAGRVMHSGAFKEQVNSSCSAEMRCIINALHTLIAQGWVLIDKIVINTDSLNSIHVFTNDKTNIIKHNLKWASDMRGLFNNIKFNSPLRNTPIVFKHIVSHQDNATKRAWVNQWCDDKAKEQLWKKINKK